MNMQFRRKKGCSRDNGRAHRGHRAIIILILVGSIASMVLLILSNVKEDDTIYFNYYSYNNSLLQQEQKIVSGNDASPPQQQSERGQANNAYDAEAVVEHHKGSPHMDMSENIPASPHGAVEKLSNQSSNKSKSKKGKEEDWTWYDGDLNKYYNKLEHDEHAKRDPNKITSYAVHRWMGPDHSTMVHYELVRKVIYDVVLGQYAPPPNASRDDSRVSKLRVFDAGCGLGAGLMWFETHEPTWELVGHTISEEQHKWIMNDLPTHNFEAKLRTYDEPLGDGNVLPFHAMYSLEAAIHSPNLKATLSAWSKAILPGGVIVIIDDFLSVGVPRDDPDVDLFARSWIAHAVHTTTEIADWADQMDMTLVNDRDLGSEFQIIKRNYRNRIPVLADEQGRTHQGWLGSKVRHKLMVEGKISYRLIAIKKNGKVKKEDVTLPMDSQS